MTAKAIVSETGTPLRELEDLKNDLVGRNNAGRVKANWEGLQESLTARLKSVSAKITEEAKGEMQKGSAVAAVEMVKATESIVKAVGEQRG